MLSLPLHAVKEHVRGIEEPLWGPITAHSQWGEEQKPLHASYLSLYFDLIFVAIAGKLNDIIVDGVTRNNFIFSALLAAALFASTEGLWDLKSSFDGRYAYNDLFHRVFVLLVGSIFALAALAIGTFDDMNDAQAPYALLFSCAVFVYYLLDVIAHMEMVIPINKSQASNVTNSARFVQIPHTIGMLLAAAAIATSASGVALVATGILWFLPAVTSRLFVVFVIAIRSQLLSRKNSVPMQISFSIRRWHEFFLIIGAPVPVASLANGQSAAGDGIISIIREPVANTADFYATFFFSFFLLSTICMLHFSSAPHDPNQHALRRNSYRGIIWIFLQKSIFFFLIPCSAGFRLLLSSVEQAERRRRVLTTALPTDAPTVAELITVPYADQSSTWLLAGSTTILLVLIMVSRVLHHGFYEEFVYLDAKELKVKLLLWFVRLGCALAILGAPAIGAPAWGCMLYVWGLTCLCFAFHVVDMQTFSDHHREHIEAEVAERKERYARENAEAAVEGAGELPSISQDQRLALEVAES